MTAGIVVVMSGMRWGGMWCDVVRRERAGGLEVPSPHGAVVTRRKRWGQKKQKCKKDRLAKKNLKKAGRKKSGIFKHRGKRGGPPTHPRKSRGAEGGSRGPRIP